MIYKFGELFDIIDGDRGSNYPKDNDFFDQGYCLFLNAGNVTKSGWSFDNNIFISEEKDKQLRKGRVERGNTVLTTRGTVGNAAYYSDRVQYDHIRINSGMVILSAKDQRIIDNEFIYYLVTSPLARKIIESFCSGSAQPQLPIKDFVKIKYDLPDLSRQREIVAILSAYDSLIETNNKKIKLLDKMAENLYNEWFVRFRFPNYESKQFINGVPANWSYCKLKEIFDIRYGKEHKNVGNGLIPIFGSGGLMRFGDSALYDGESILIPRKGTLNNIMYHNGPFWTVDTMFYTVLLKDNVAKYLYYILSNIDMESFNSGAALPSMTTDILYHMKILIPDSEVLSSFDHIISDLYKEKEVLFRRNDKLNKQRNLLFPRLMNGTLGLQNAGEGKMS